MAVQGSCFHREQGEFKFGHCTQTQKRRNGKTGNFTALHRCRLEASCPLIKCAYWQHIWQGSCEKNHLNSVHVEAWVANESRLDNSQLTVGGTLRHLRNAPNMDNAFAQRHQSHSLPPSGGLSRRCTLMIWEGWKIPFGLALELQSICV